MTRVWAEACGRPLQRGSSPLSLERTRSCFVLASSAPAGMPQARGGSGGVALRAWGDPRATGNLAGPAGRAASGRAGRGRPRTP